MRLATLALLLALAPLAAPAVLADDPFVVVRIERGDRLQFQIVPKSQFEATKDRLESEFEAARDRWKKDPKGDEPDRPRIRKLAGEHATKQEAERALREEADRNARFACPRCNGTGEVTTGGGDPDDHPVLGVSGLKIAPKVNQATNPQPATKERCPDCNGHKRTKSDGYALLRVESGEKWTLVLVRRAAQGIYADAVRAAGGSTRVVENFQAGEWDEAHEALATRTGEAKGEEGFDPRLGIQGVRAPRVEWPKEFFVR
ncbi:MAG: hypothetical protein HY720_19470 [Planctomycetes bacterium]|nr:hypothetical protein [Planctomycetota bacterium]